MMKNLRIPSALALVLGIVMAIWGGRLPLHQNDLARQTDGEFIIYMALTAGGFLIAIIAAFGLGRSSTQVGGRRSVPGRAGRLESDTNPPVSKGFSP
jgi:hypothetical protein